MRRRRCRVERLGRKWPPLPGGSIQLLNLQRCTHHAWQTLTVLTARTALAARIAQTATNAQAARIARTVLGAPTARIAPTALALRAKPVGLTTSRPPCSAAANFLEFLESYDCMILEHMLPEWPGAAAAAN